MMKKLGILFILMCIFLVYGITYAYSAMPAILIDNVNVDVSGGFYFENGTIYIEPSKISQLFNVNFDSVDDGYVFYNPVRKVSVNSSGEYISVFDVNSFSSTTEHCDSLYKNGFIKLRAICEAFDIDINYDVQKHSVYIDQKNYSVGLYTENGLAVSFDGNYYGLVDRQGNIVLPFKYNSISNHENTYIYKVKQNSEFGLVNSFGKLITDVIYDNIEYVSFEEIYLYHDGQKGMCNIEGNIIIPVEYADIAYCGNMISMVKVGAKWSLLNCVSGEISYERYDEVYKLTGGVHTENHMIKGYYVVKNSKWGYIDSFGNKIIDIKYEALDKFDQFGRARMVYNGKMGIIDCGGSIIIPAAYDYIYKFGNGKIAVAQLGQKYGALNLDGSIAIPFEYEYMNSFNDAPVTIAYKSPNFYVINIEGNIVSEKSYSYAEEFKNGLALVLTHDGGYGYIDYNCNEIIECVHTEVKQGTSNSLFLKKDNKWALYSASGQNLSGYVYDDAGEFENGLSAVSKTINGKLRYGYINEFGKEIIPYIYTSAQKFKYGRAIVSYDDMYGIIDVDGNTVIPFEYKGFNPSYDYVVIAAADFTGKWGLISFMNEKLTKFEYDYIYEFENNFALVLKNHKYGIIDTSGKIIIDPECSSSHKAFELLEKQLTSK